MNEHVHGAPLEQLRTPFVAIATRLSRPTARDVQPWRHGPCGARLVGEPGQFEPVEIGNDTYVDGDETSPVPIRVARKLGAKVVIAVDVSAYAKDTPAGRAAASGSTRTSGARARWPRRRREADVVIHPNIGYYAGENEATGAA